MLCEFSAKGFKSLADVTVRLPQFSVLFGPNATGKSNLLEAVQILARFGTERTLADAFAGSLRGYPLEAFAFPPGGMPELVQSKCRELELKAVLESSGKSYHYRVAVGIQTSSGVLSVRDEHLVGLTKRGKPKGRPQIERVDGNLHIRRKGKPAHPRQESIGLNHTLLSDARLGGQEYAAIEACRNEMEGWRIYYLDPRVSMRRPSPPADVHDIGSLGENLAPFLYRLQSEQPRHFAAVRRTLRSLIPTIESLSVDLDERRGTLDILVRQDGINYSSRIVSEGTLRVLALCAIAVNPWARGLVGFEEPENGVHPRRLELIAQLLTSLAVDQGRQVIVTSHSPLFCNAMLKQAEAWPDKIGLFHVRRREGKTEVQEFEQRIGSLFKDPELAAALRNSAEDGVFEALVVRGVLDE